MAKSWIALARSSSLGLLCLGLAACLLPNTLDDRALNDGVTRDVEAPFVRASAAADAALDAVELETARPQLIGESRIVNFKRPTDDQSWGEIGRVVVTPVDSDTTRITVTLENRYRPQPHRITEREFAAAFFGDVEAALARR